MYIVSAVEYKMESLKTFMHWRARQRLSLNLSKCLLSEDALFKETN